MKTLVWFGFVLGALSAAGNVLVTKPEQTITLECGVDTFKSSLEWRRENEKIFSLDKTFLKRKGTNNIVARSYERNTNLEIRKVKLEDAGKFTCLADGKSTRVHTLLVVSVSANPSGDLHVGSEVTLTCQVSGLSPEPAVQWQGPDGTKRAGSLKSVARSDAGTWKCVFTYGQETHSGSIDIKVTDPPAPTTPPPGPFQSSPDPLKPTNPNSNPTSGAFDLLGLKWWVWVAIGVGCLVVILLMVFVICLCKKIKTKKRRLQKMRNSYQLPVKYCQCNCPTAVAKPQQGRRREKPSAPPLQPLLME